eukprot:CAMPEP_0117688012 /NCGR_PEP_ID=MMETSP0804-20121206/23530_1 /TAXON_ID=1074897 /ORGANISM="Tetraselmis astigmatica, Strain CCMP880" /LENGTH=324 /DNA_ID=CAMNT_0005500291 /DNA_START=240 /DNA_END=1214 /DNA_ORIENTATION=-
MGAVFGGILTAAANWSSEASSASLATYAGFLLVMLAGSLLSLLLANPATVVRPDGSPVQASEDPLATIGGAGGLQKYTGELRAMGATAAEPLVALLLPLALYSNWFYTYQFSCFNHEVFSIRTQGFNNSLYWMAQMAGAWALGRFLDARAHSCSPQVRARRSLAVIANLVLGTWMAAALAVPPGAATSKLDVASGGVAYLEAVAVYLLWGVGDSLVMVWLLWVLGQNTDDLQMLARYSGLVKAVQSCGSAVSWKLNTAEVGFPLGGQFWLNVVLAGVGMLSAWRSLGHIRGAPACEARQAELVAGSEALEGPTEGGQSERDRLL